MFDPSKTPEHYVHDAAIVAAVRARLPAVRVIWRFGSAGGPYELADSDLDVAVLAEDRIPFRTGLDLEVDLMTVSGRDADVVDMRAIPVTLRVQIAAQGARLFCREAGEAAEYESRALSDYARLNEERRGILADARERGTIYG